MSSRSKRTTDDGSTAIYDPARHDDRRAAVAVIDALGEPSELRTLDELPPAAVALGTSAPRTLDEPSPGESNTFDEQADPTPTADLALGSELQPVPPPLPDADDPPALGDPPSLPPTAVVQATQRRASTPTTPAPAGPPPPSPPQPAWRGTELPPTAPRAAPYPTHVDAPGSEPIRVISMKDSEPVRRPREDHAPIQVQLRAIAAIARRDQPDVVDRNLAWEQARARQARRNVRWIVLGVILAAAIALAIWLIAGR